MLKNFDIEKIDTNKLADCLGKSRRASYSAREALCIEIGVDFNELDFGQTAPRDFAIQLVAHLKQMGDTTALLKLCQAIKYKTNILNTGYLIWSSLLKVLLATGSVTVLVLLMRYLGVLQPAELWAFDQLMRLRSSVVEEGRDRRLLVVTIDDKDIQYQNEQGMKRQGSLSDRALALLLKKLEQYQAQIIGLDIYHDYEFDQANLLTELQQNQHFFAVCKVSDPEVGTIGVAPPRGIPKESIAFSDMVRDEDGIIRRHLLSLVPPAASRCQAQSSLSTRLAFDYLNTKDFTIQVTPEGYWQVGHVIFKAPVILKTITSHTAGYQGIDVKGHQILLNYRSVRSPESIAHRVTLQDILNNRVAPISVKDKIVLIGVTAPHSVDSWGTPYGKKIPRVFVQAHMVSQILSAVLDDRSLLWVWSPGSEALWVWGWSLAGGTIACCSWRPRNLIIAGSTALGILLAICFGIFIGAGWVPLIPPALASILSMSSGWIVDTRFNIAQRQKQYIKDDKEVYWTEKHRPLLRKGQAIEEEAKEWNKHGRSRDFLLKGIKLQEAENLLKIDDPKLTASVKEFISRSIQEREIQRKLQDILSQLKSYPSDCRGQVNRVHDVLQTLQVTIPDSDEFFQLLEELRDSTAGLGVNSTKFIEMADQLTELTNLSSQDN